MHVRQIKRYAEALLNAKVCGVLPQGKYITFASGLRSPVYLNNRLLLSHPTERTFIARGMTRVVDELVAEHPQVNAVAAVESGGTPLATLIADSLNLPLYTVRKAEKKHGEKRRVEGGSVAGKHVIVIEDHLTTAGSALSAAGALKDEGAEVVGVSAITRYNFALPPEGKKIHELLRDHGLWMSVLVEFSDLLQEIEARGAVPEDDLQQVRAWFRDPATWHRAQSTTP
ncbi:MAG: hypothetical protein KBE09_03975 [Candidatus Pacebacteria bacterium]|nr:hypothetical protein [Candidatus Paceibacterota bacterium]